jgi:sulfate adenylyltransferase
LSFEEDKGALVKPYGGNLIDLFVPEEERTELRARVRGLPHVRLSPRGVCDLELLATGGFSPLEKFMGRADYESVIETMRLASGLLFPIPITLPLDESVRVHLDSEVALTDQYNDLLAVMRVEEVYEPDKRRESRAVCGTEDAHHPLVAEMRMWGGRYASGELRVLSLPRHDDFKLLRLTPREVRGRLMSLGRRNVVAFQTRNPLHRVHEELTVRAAASVGGTLLLHPSVGMTKPGDIDHYTRVRTYQALMSRRYDTSRTLLALLPLAMRMAGPREALWHAIIRRNFGANHFIVGRDHASPGTGSNGEPFYGAYEARELLEEYGARIGVKPIAFRELVYIPEEERYEEPSRVPRGMRTLSVSGTELREEYLRRGRAVPEWFMRPEVSAILAQAYPPAHHQGFCVWLTGLSGAGKSTTASILAVRLLEHGRATTMLDGDVVRANLSKGLGFGREDRDTNIRRIGFVASEIVRHGGAVICAAVSPYRATRDECRALVGAERFFEVYADAPLAVCEARDPKGLYALARAGELKGLTGVDDPYEQPPSPELRIDTGGARTAEENVDLIISLLAERAFIPPAPGESNSS